MDQVLGNHPLVFLPAEVGNSASGLPLADPEFCKPSLVDLLLGSDVAGQVLCSGSVIALHRDGLIAFPSVFGYLVMGPAFPFIQSNDQTVFTGVSLAEVVQRFWKVEEVPSIPHTDPLDLECESHYRRTLPLDGHSEPNGAHRERATFPRAAAILETDLYVDDICTGASSEHEALLLRDELIGILATAGYELRKWVSNCPRLLPDLPADHRQDPLLFEDSGSPHCTSVLGVQYQPVSDTFSFRFTAVMAKLWTKRSVLSTVATIFDPNGWIAPVIFWAKYFLQRLWIAEISWDEPITGDLLTDWLGFLNRLESITQVSIPRHFLPSGKYKASLHGFCDASVSGYATVVY
ncbi:unnamed protein product [Arctia plantaginis]|uniref:Uncharacterized protein n=1 Tax=Arctia plantaginis TaxID=874455 RepID=A0A8S1BN44_ARCPL|nr:unnamed protein product [Arctia plantaginis]